MSPNDPSQTAHPGANGDGRLSVQLRFPFAPVTVKTDGMPSMSLGGLMAAVDKAAKSDSPREDLELILRAAAQAHAKQEITGEQLEEVRAALGTVRFLHLSAAERDAVVATVATASEDWEKSLAWVVKGKGKAKKKVLAATAGNAALVLARRPEWQGCLSLNEFSSVIHWDRQPPPLRGLARPAGELSDADFTYVGQWLQLEYGVTFSRDAVAAAVESAARAKTTHPVREYLRALRWDGIPRLGTWLHTCLGAEDTDENRRIGTWWPISAVARVMEPGCQADHVLILEGDQGLYKSKALRVFGGPWYSGSLGNLRDKDGPGSLQGFWIIEIAELDAIRGTTLTMVKDFLTRVIDVYRPAYGRNLVRRRRQCVFAGTTNERQYLADATGGRRFWPVAITKVDIERLVTERDQLWAEAVVRFDAGEKWWPEGIEVQRLAELQEQRFEVDSWEETVAWFLSTVEEVSTNNLMVHLQVERGRERPAQMRIADIMRRLGWKQRREVVKEKGIRLRRWVRGPGAAPKAVPATATPDSQTPGAPGQTKVISNDFNY